MKYFLIGAVAAICILAFNIHTLRGIIEGARAELTVANADLKEANARTAATLSEAAVCHDMIPYRGQPVILLHARN